jgi:hypothetical protein
MKTKLVEEKQFLFQHDYKDKIGNKIGWFNLCLKIFYQILRNPLIFLFLISCT